ncbi:MAG: penicillin acylase family protein, partial [Nitriliruptorales bacterium]|nr:penicillin acylase family protein [Nitriliruptorales bacterium]
VMNVAGGSLYGVPVVLIGHTEGVAWSHTVSTAFRFTPFELTLVPGAPTTYLVDGEPKVMEQVPVTIEVKTDSGIEERSKSIWRTDYGWVTTGLLGLPIFPWTSGKAWALGDANEHMRYLNHFFEINHAQNTSEVQRILKEYQGIPWVNTISADRDGKAYYADIGSIPNVPDAHADRCNTATGVGTTGLIGLPVLDGSRSDCAWQTDEDAVAPGIFGPGNLPDLFRNDYVSNSNDSYWLTNPEEPITGYAEIIGDEETARTLRTRLGLRIVLDRMAGSDEYTAIHPDRFTQDILQDAVFNNRQHAGELTRDAAVAMCRSFPGGQAPSSSGPVAVEQDGVNACDVLEAWDLRDNLDSVGALLFRRFWTHADDATGGPWVNGFDVEDPVNTPNTLNTDHPEVQEAFGNAINDLVGAGIPLDAPLGNWQHEDRDDEAMYGDVDTVGAIPIHGGPGSLGVFNAINVSWDGDASDGDAGYPDVDHGSSFVMVAHFVDGDCPVDADAIVTYSQSENPNSPWFADQTRAYSEKRWNDMPFCESEIAAATVDTTTIAQAAPSGGGGSEAPAADEDDLPTTGGGFGLMGLSVLGLAGLAGRRRRS